MTKKINLLLATVFCVVLNAQSQNKFNFGVKAGANYSKLLDYVNDSKNKVGFQVGGFMQYSISENIRLQPELLFSLEGGKSDFNFEGTDQSIMLKENISLGFINLPVMLQYKIYKGLHFELGPQIGYIVLAENKYDAKFDFGEIPIEDEGTSNIIDDLNKIQFSANVGLHYDINNSFSVQFRYNRGFSKLVKSSIEQVGGELDQIVDYDKIRNQSFTIGVGYQF